MLLPAWVPTTVDLGSLYVRASQGSCYLAFAFLDPVSSPCDVLARNSPLVFSWPQLMPTTSCASDHSSRISILYTFLEWVGGPGNFLVALQHQGYTMVSAYGPKAQWDHVVL